MDKEYINKCLFELISNRKNELNTESTFLETALFIEDIFNIVLDDSEISKENLDNYENMKKLVYKKTGLK